MIEKLIIVADTKNPSTIMGNDDGTITLYNYTVKSTGIESPVHIYRCKQIVEFKNYMPIPGGELDLDYNAKEVIFEYITKDNIIKYVFNVSEMSNDILNNANYIVYKILKTSNGKYNLKLRYDSTEELEHDIETYNQKVNEKHIFEDIIKSSSSLPDLFFLTEEEAKKVNITPNNEIDVFAWLKKWVNAYEKCVGDGKANDFINWVYQQPMTQ